MKTLTLFAIVLLGIGCVPGVAMGCPVFREPAVNFAGLTSQDQINQYFSNVVEPQIWAAQDELISCHRRLVDEAPRGYKADTRARNDIENEQWGADLSRFVQRFNQASKAHLALLAAQPFKDAYSGQGMASRGGAAYSQEQARSAPPPKGSLWTGVPPSSSNTATQRPGDGGESAQSGRQGSGRPTYQPITHCAQVVRRAERSDELHNRCTTTLEFFWRDRGDKWNSMTTITAGKYHPYAGRVLQAVACRQGDLFDKKRGLCVDW